MHIQDDGADFTHDEAESDDDDSDAGGVRNFNVRTGRLAMLVIYIWSGALLSSIQSACPHCGTAYCSQLFCQMQVPLLATNAHFCPST